MDKRTILAVVLMVVIITIGFSIQGLFVTPETAATTTASPSPKASASTTPVMPEAPVAAEGTGSVAVSTASPDAGLLDPSKPADALIPIADSELGSEAYIYENSKLKVRISAAGANLTSLKLKEYKDGNDLVEMFMPGKDSGLGIREGSFKGELLTVPFRKVATNDRNVLEFRRDFSLNGARDKVFSITKRYTFFPDDYLFQLDVIMQNSANAAIPYGKDGFTYTLSLGPQIGPVSSNIMQNQDYRRLVYLNGTDRQQQQLGQRAEFTVPNRVTWAAVDGKYFTFFVIPGAADYKIRYATPDMDAGKMGSTLDLSRQASGTSQVADSYRIYAGPKLSNVLDNYNSDSDNKAGQSGLNLDKVVDLGWLWWLEEGLKWLMQLFYQLIPNWGVAIILITILVKVAMYPLTKKSMESTAKMQALNPQMTEIREKYAKDPQRMNQEMAELYKREKINPLGGCLPILLQFPFFFAMYNLFYSHFDLRGAMFIPGWISDLSLPETVIHFTFPMPLLGFTVTGLHVLPFLYLGSQFLSTKLTTAQNPGTSNGQMKFMMYGLPAIFFFVLYEVPSGLLVYWIFQNLLQIVQQQFANRHIEKLRAQQQVSEIPRHVIKPGQAGKSASVIKGKNDPKKSK